MSPDVLQTFLLAFIQSATEFIPVSSSAHLLLFQSFGWTHQGVFSDVAMHAGTLLAVLVYFYQDIYKMVCHLFDNGPEHRLARNLVIATLPIIVGGALGAEVIMHLRVPAVIAGMSIIFGILLYISDRLTYAGTDLRSMTALEALCIGLGQVLSLVPGVSRSGITITCCRALGFSRRESTRFAMLLSVPTISAAAAYMCYLAWRNREWNLIFNMDTLIGTCLSAVMGLLVIRFLMRWVRRSSFGIFVVYRILLGLFIFYYFCV